MLEVPLSHPETETEQICDPSLPFAATDWSNILQDYSDTLPNIRIAHPVTLTLFYVNMLKKVAY